ncbi:MAG: dihydropteroate synthase [Candidatus Geothermincolia bacterium]
MPDSENTLMIGERINPTGRPALAAELKLGKTDMALEDARAQAAAGAHIIDVNTGVPGIDEAELLTRIARQVHEETGLPVCVDSSDPEVIRQVIPLMPAGTLINSVTGDEESLLAVLPCAAENGSLVIGMAKDRAGIPGDAAGRLEVARRIAEAAARFDIPPERLLIDFLTIPVAVENGSAVLTLECIARAKAELGVGTVLGASNISFGMPERHVINASFLSMAIFAGLTAAIVNPLEEGIVENILASDALTGRDARCKRYLKYYRSKRRGAAADKPAT